MATGKMSGREFEKKVLWVQEKMERLANELVNFEPVNGYFFLYTGV